MAMHAETWNAIRGLLVGILCVVPIAAFGGKMAMTVDDMLDLVRVDDVVMTPDGSKVFYTERRLDWAANEQS